tara:strand:- start:4975 stop:7452 length:2478 start_codon:yes stop_codon:yes gene_type:complete
MAQEKIIIKFVPDGNKRLVSAINALKDAQMRLVDKNEKVKKTFTELNPKMLKLYASLKTQGKGWAALGISVDIGTKALKGNKQAMSLVDAKLKSLSATTEGAAFASKLLSTRNKRLTNVNNKLAMSFATLRSQLLLISFAMGIGIRQIMGFVKEASKLEAMKTAFNNLAGGAGNAQIALTQLSKAAGGTMSKFDLLQQANNALILGVVENSEQMGEMFNIAIRLGRAVGRDATSSVESLVTGIGRQSRLMLDNLGIMMSAEKAYADYAAELDVTVESLDDTERRQAFLNATMASARLKVSLLGEEIVNMQTRMERVGAAWDDSKVALGNLSVLAFDLDTNLSLLAETTEAYSSIIDTKATPSQKNWNTVFQNTIRAFILSKPMLMTFAVAWGFNAKSIKLFSEALDEAKEKLIEFERIQLEANKKLKATFKTLVEETVEAQLRQIEGMIILVQKNKELFKSQKDYENVLRDLKDKYNDLDPAYQQHLKHLAENERLTKLEEKAQERLNRLLAKQAERKRAEDIQVLVEKLKFLTQANKDNERSISNAIRSEIRAFNALEKAENDALKVALQRANNIALGKDMQMVEVLKAEEDAMNGVVRANEDLNDILATGIGVYAQTEEGQRKFIERQIDIIMTNRLLLGGFIDVDAALLKLLEDYGNVGKEAEGLTLETKLATQSMAMLANEMARLVVETGSLKALKPGKLIASMVLGGIFQKVGSTILTGLGIGHKGGLIKDDGKIQRFAGGGTIRGGDNVPILAQGGEFVMQRSAVESIGIENLNRMNQGSGGAITVNVSGNVLSQDFVEGELAENIKEAIRRGTDFGIS